MNSTDLDKIVDKLLVFRTRLPKLDQSNLTWWQRECLKETHHDINRLITTIDYLGDAFK